MPRYHRLGAIPRTKHVAFRREGGALHREELFSSRGFSGPYSTRYHLRLPPALLESRELTRHADRPWPAAPLGWLHLDSERAPPGGDFVSSRVALLENAHCRIGVASPTEDSDFFFRNARAWELLFVHRGSGTFESDFGDLRFEPGDQLVIPRSVTWRLSFDSWSGNKLLFVESASALEIPAHYRNPAGQLTEEAPYSERDLKVPEALSPRDEEGRFRLLLAAGERLFEQVLPHHPFDVVGWDGYLYPFALNVRDFQPKVGRIHLPPPVHLAFRAEQLVVCDFVPRPYDFHPEAIPAPYFHSNVDSDEVLYYAGGEFMSRRGISEGSLTLHPAGMPHGPQPGRTEDSVGAKSTNELAIMIDTFQPLRPTLAARERLHEGYERSWLEPGQPGARP